MKTRQQRFTNNTNLLSSSIDLGAAGENVTRVRLVRFVRKHATGVAPTELHTVRVERGMIWQEAIDK